MNTRFLRLAKSPKSTAKPKISSDEVFGNMAISYSKRPQRSKDHRTGLGIFFGGPELPKNQKNENSRPVQRLQRSDRQMQRFDRKDCGWTAGNAGRTAIFLGFFDFSGVLDLRKRFRDQFCDPFSVADVLSIILPYFRKLHRN